jgi:hypothetical protein
MADTDRPHRQRVNFSEAVTPVRREYVPGEPVYDLLRKDGARIIVDVTDLLIDIYAVMQIFRSLRFADDEVFFNVALTRRRLPDSLLFYGVTLLHGRAAPFHVTLYPRDCIRIRVMREDEPQSNRYDFCDEPEVLELWARFNDDIKHHPERLPGLDTRLLESVLANLEPLTASLRHRGFSIPAFERAIVIDAAKSVPKEELD